MNYKIYTIGECPAPPEKQNGTWNCDADHTACTLTCDPGFMSLHTEVWCSDGKWDKIIQFDCWLQTNPIAITG